ncbi:MAG: LacI family DNA-binding transcriptional regulator [Janthinobacterium lividum]
MAATMREVAEAAGVSIATVSFVVNDSKPVAPETRRRIEEAMSRLGFRRNMVGRALASRRTRIVALVYPAMEHKLGGSAMEFITSAARTAAEAGYHLVLWPVSNDAGELTELLGQGLVDGVLLMEVQLEDHRVEVLRATRTPFALIGRTADLTGLAYVDIDFERTVEQAVDHLYALGHRRLVLVSGSQADASFRSYGPYVRASAAYRRIAAERGFDAVILECEQSTDGGRSAADQILGSWPETTAVLVLNEFAAPGLVSGLLRHGVRIPADLSVLSILTSTEMSLVVDPALTAMSSPGAELGELGVQALLRSLEGAAALPPRLLPGTLVPGESTGPAR